MSVSSNPGVEEALELARRLAGTVQEFAARETELNQEFRAKSTRERMRQEEAASAELGRLTGQQTRLEEEFTAAMSAAESLYERRKTRITKARTTSKEQTLGRIEGKTGAQKYELQRS